MPNENVNKVTLGDETLIDLTSDTVSAETMLLGATAHDASGATVTGTVVTADEMTTTDIDDVVDDDAPTGTEYMSTSRLSYFWTKLKAFFLPQSEYRRALTWGEARDQYTWGSIRGDYTDTGATTTQNLGLTKPGTGSPLDVSVINANMGIIDAAVGDVGNTDLQTQVSANTSGVETANNYYRSLSHDVVAAETNISNLQTTANTLTNQMTDVQSTVAAHDSDIVDLEADMGAAKFDIQELQDSVSKTKWFSTGSAAALVRSGQAWVFFAVSTDAAGYAVVMAQAITTTSPSICWVHNESGFAVATNAFGTVDIEHNGTDENVRMIALRIV